MVFYVFQWFQRKIVNIWARHIFELVTRVHCWDILESDMKLRNLHSVGLKGVAVGFGNLFETLVQTAIPQKLADGLPIKSSQRLTFANTCTKQ